MATVADLPPRSGVYDVLREQWEEKKWPEIGFALVELMIELRNSYEQLECLDWRAVYYQSELDAQRKLPPRGIADSNPEEESLIRESLEINSEAHGKWKTRGNYTRGKTSEKMWAERWYKHWDLCFTRQRAELLYIVSGYYEHDDEFIGSLLNTIELAEECPRIRLKAFFWLLQWFEEKEEVFSAKKICSLYWRKIQSDFPEDMGAPKNNDSIRETRFFCPSEKSFYEYDRNRQSHPRSSKWIEPILREDWDYDSEKNLVEFIEAQSGYSEANRAHAEDPPWRKEWILDAISKVSDITPDKEKKRKYASMWEELRDS